MTPQDHEALEIILTGALDRKIPGDPSWWYLIGAPASSKTEQINAMAGLKCVYPLDTLTPQTFVSGLTRNNKETGEPEPIGGLLRKMDGKTLMVKDFTTILQGNKDNREEIFGQLRSIYDGKFEKGFGTLPEPIRIKATIGAVFGVTPIVDKYTNLQSLLGERHLKIRINPDPMKAAIKALENEGREGQLRQDLRNAVQCFVEHLDLNKIPTISMEYTRQILAMGMYIASMRANVWKQYNENGQLVDADVLYREIPTRICKQLKHTAKLLAMIRGEEEVGEAEMATLGRVAKDTADQKKQEIIEVFNRCGWDQILEPSYIASQTRGLFRGNAAVHLEVMQLLGAMNCVDKGYGLTDDFRLYAQTVYRHKERKDPQKPLEVYTDLPPPVTEAARKQPRLDHTCVRCLQPIKEGDPYAVMDHFVYCETCKAVIVNEKRGS